MEVGANMEGNDGGVVSGEEIFVTFLNFPVGSFWEFCKAMFVKFFSAPLNNVEGRLGFVDEVEELVG